MVKRIDMVGMRFGRLSVIKFSGITATRKSIWSCVCDCGSSKEVTRGQLVRKETMSCGCLKSETARMNFKKNWRPRGAIFSREEARQRNCEKTARALKASRQVLGDYYIKHLIRNQTGCSSTKIPAQLIDAKRAHLQLVRLMDELNNEKS